MSSKVYFIQRTWVQLSIATIYLASSLEIENDDFFLLDQDIRKYHEKNALPPWKILGANIHRWANFTCFFQKKIHQYPFFSKMIYPNFIVHDYLP